MSAVSKILKDVADGKVTGRKLKSKADAVAAASSCGSKDTPTNTSNP